MPCRNLNAICVVLSVCAAIAMSSSIKQIKRILPRTQAHWVGDGFNVYPLFSDLAFTEEISPFLMFDYGAPKVFDSTNKKRGVGNHPHRGMETVTIALQGEVEHGDSLGNSGVIGPGYNAISIMMLGTDVLILLPLR